MPISSGISCLPAIAEKKNVMLHLFCCKVFYEKYFQHFSLFGGGENNGQ